jgi:hypothetical protein
LKEGLATYKSQSVSEGDTNTVELDRRRYILAVLGVDAMAIERCSGLSKPPDGPEVEEWCSDLFAYYREVHKFVACHISRNLFAPGPSEYN